MVCNTVHVFYLFIYLLLIILSTAESEVLTSPTTIVELTFSNVHVVLVQVQNK